MKHCWPVYNLKTRIMQTFRMAFLMYNISLVFLTSFFYHISSFDLNGLPKSENPSGSLACKTHNMTTMDCSNRYLVGIPYLDQNLTTILDLSYNHLIEINGAPFEQLPLLWELDLGYNRLSHLSSTAFRGLWFLVALKLRDNNIEALPSGIFVNLTNWKSLTCLVICFLLYQMEHLKVKRFNQLF